MASINPTLEGYLSAVRKLRICLPRPETSGTFPRMPLFSHILVSEKILNTVYQSKKFQKQSVDAESEELLELTRLVELANRWPNTLSGGEKQKTALARSLACRPRILLLDEPLSGIDEETRRDLQNVLKKIHRETGLTTLHVTHDHSEAYGISDRMAIIRRGSIVQTGTPDDMYRNPVDESTASFLGFENILAASPGVEPNEVKVNGIHMVIAEKRNLSRCKVCVRGEEIILSGSQKKDDVNTFQGRIIGVRAVGGLFDIRVDIGFELRVTMSRREYLALRRREHDGVFVTIPMEAIRVFEES